MCCRCANNNAAHYACYHTGPCSLCALHGGTVQFPYKIGDFPDPMLAPVIPIQQPIQIPIQLVPTDTELLREILKELKELRNIVQRNSY